MLPRITRSGMALYLSGILLCAGCPADPGAGGPPDAADAGVADAASPDDAAVGAPSAVCSVDGWCWRNPLPQGNSLYSVFVADATHVFVAGIRGTLMMWNGSALIPQTSGTRSFLNSVSGTDAGNVWAVGTEGTILRYAVGGASAVGADRFTPAAERQRAA
ncbi:MAG: hypothetical protein U1A78_17950 [Polyangia bacterium]